ncbi:ferredoxin [Pseudohyphozyma bogoriensis]|nr:ferredoxin [Pseudohyphozyma bogoriensis]
MSSAESSDVSVVRPESAVDKPQVAGATASDEQQPQASASATGEERLAGASEPDGQQEGTLSADTASGEPPVPAKDTSPALPPVPLPDSTPSTSTPQAGYRGTLEMRAGRWLDEIKLPKEFWDGGNPSRLQEGGLMDGKEAEWLTARRADVEESVKEWVENLKTASLHTTARTSKAKELVGSAPFYTRHLVIHTPHPPSTWPSRIESASPLYVGLAERWGRHEELSKVGFAFSDGGKNGGEGFEEGKFENESYEAYLYPDYLRIPSISLSNLASIESLILSLPSSPPTPPPSATTSSPPKKRATIYVCTHGSRDCRCGDLGEPLVTALESEVEWRKLGGEDGVTVKRVSHIGGHVWAGNALVYREDGTCDWYGLLRESDAAQLVFLSQSDSTEPWWPRWRGRLGVSPEKVKEMYDEAIERGSPMTKVGKRDGRKRVPLGDPVELVFNSWDGAEEYVVTGFEGESVMEVARRHDLPSIQATCGGACECATCHVLVKAYTPEVAEVTGAERRPTPVPTKPVLPPLSDEEEEQLDFAMGRTDDSRLSCQLPVTKELGEWIAQGGAIDLPRF